MKQKGVITYSAFVSLLLLSLLIFSPSLSSNTHQLPAHINLSRDTSPIAIQTKPHRTYVPPLFVQWCQTSFRPGAILDRSVCYWYVMCSSIVVELFEYVFHTGHDLSRPSPSVVFSTHAVFRVLTTMSLQVTRHSAGPRATTMYVLPSFHAKITLLISHPICVVAKQQSGSCGFTWWRPPLTLCW